MKVAVIGGGTGSSAILNGLKEYPDLEISVIVGMADSGGSNRVIRDEFGLLPLSDLRKSIIALSELSNNHKLRKLLTYRFSEGDGLKEHTLGNLMMIAISSFTGNTQDTVNYMRELFQVNHNVYPVSFSDSDLVAKYESGKVLHGEHEVDEPDVAEDDQIIEAWLEPKSKGNPQAIKAIEEADFIIVGPGDLYTTTLVNFYVEGISEACVKSDAKKLFITSLMTKHGQTRQITQSEIIQRIEEVIGAKFDKIFLNTEEIPQSVLDHYKSDGEFEIENDISEDPRIIKSNLIADEIFNKKAGDSLVRSLVRHDSKALGWEVYKYMKSVELG